MSRPTLRKPSPALSLAIVAVVLSTTGSAVAASLITSKQIKDGTIQTKDLTPKVRKALKSQRGPAGPAGLAGPLGATGSIGDDGAEGAPGPPGTDGTSGTSTGETFFASAAFGSNFGGGGTCDTAPSGGPSITFTAPSGSYAQVMASATVQRAGASSNTVCVRVDSTDVQFSSSASLSAETRYLQQGSASGTTDPLAARPLTFPVGAGSHTISMRYGSSGGTSSFSNRNLHVTVFHPTT